jgi:hypothetical protein
MAVNACVHTRSPSTYSITAETRSGAGRDTFRTRKIIPFLTYSASAADANQPGACCWMITHPSSVT